ncbi:hypothetical protein L218DRAFT_952692 [Marasmius fiardii PR-910]|nr:hypothetical protein L218DRAFT_952692 [Marasmius fiardii PR-910]
MFSNRSDGDDDEDSASSSGSSSRRASPLFSEASTLSPPSSTSGKRRASDSSLDRPTKRSRLFSAPPMTLPTFSVNDWFNEAQFQTQFPTDAAFSYDISTWLASVDSFSDSDSPGVTTPIDSPSTIPLPDINQIIALLELDLSTASSSLLLTTTDSLLDLCLPLQTTLPDYDYTSPDFLRFRF